MPETGTIVSDGLTVALSACTRSLAATIVAAALCVSAAAAEDYPDALLTTPVTPAILAQGAEADAYTQGDSGLCLGLPTGPDGARGAPIYGRAGEQSADQLSRAAERDRLGARPCDGGLEGHADVEQRHVLHERDRRS